MNFVARHFAARAFESLSCHLAHLIRTRGAAASEAEQLQELLECLRRVRLFPAPTDGKFLSEGRALLSTDTLPHLPATVVGLEFSYSTPIELAHPLPLLAPRAPALADKVCVLALDPLVLGQSLRKSFGLQGLCAEAFVLWPIYGYSPTFHDSLGLARERWAPAQELALLLPSKATAESTTTEYPGITLEVLTLSPPAHPALTGAVASGPANQPVQASSPLAGAANAVIELLHALACQNVTTQARLSSRKLNQNRSAAIPGKLFEYQVPVLSPGAETADPFGTNPWKHPQALHLRRGRIRAHHGAKIWEPESLRRRPPRSSSVRKGSSTLSPPSLASWR